MDIVDKSGELTKSQKQAIQVWLTCKSQAEVARRTGTAEETICRWLQQPSFAGAIRDLENSVTEEVRRAVISSQARAVEVLREQMDNDDQWVRQSAAVHLLKMGGMLQAKTQRSGDANGHLPRVRGMRAA